MNIAPVPPIARATNSAPLENARKYILITGPSVRPINPVSANIDRIPHALFLNLVVRNNKAKYPPNVTNIPIYGMLIFMDIPAVRALKSKVMESNM